MIEFWIGLSMFEAGIIVGVWLGIHAKDVIE
jgi:hypothetical protein